MILEICLAQFGNQIRTLFVPQSGVSAARNHAIRAAHGEWIAFLDDDDVWLPNKTERQMELARKNPALGLVYCSDYAVDEQLNVLYERIAASDNRGEVFERLLVRNFIFTSCVVARKQAIADAGYMSRAYRWAQDWDLWLKIGIRYPVDFVPEPLVLYRQSATGCLTRDLRADDRLAEMEAIVKHALALRTVPRKVQTAAELSIRTQWASLRIDQGMRFEALRHSLGALTTCPTSSLPYRLLLYSVVPAGIRTLAKSWAGRA